MVQTLILIQNYKQQQQISQKELMSGKCNRLDLRSNIYRDISRSPCAVRKQVKKNTNVIRSHQNICCPNCRYLFKAPLQVIPNIQKPKLIEKANAEIQTTEQDSSPPKTRSMISQYTQNHAKMLKLQPEKPDNEINGILNEIFTGPCLSINTPKYSPSSLSIVPPHLKLKSPNNSVYRQSGSPISNRNSLIANQNSMSVNQNSLTANPSKSLTVNSKSPNNYSNSLSVNQNSRTANPNSLPSPKLFVTPRKNEYLHPSPRPQKYVPQPAPPRQINHKQANHFINQMYRHQQITSILSCSLENLGSPSQTQIPGYFKMLLLQLNQKQSAQGKSQ